jgi:hypothetical protein
MMHSIGIQCVFGAVSEHQRDFRLRVLAVGIHGLHCHEVRSSFNTHVLTRSACRPTLEKEKWKYVIAVAVAEFVFSGLAEFMAMLRYTPQTQHLEVPEVVEYLFLIPATVLNVVFLLWVINYFTKLVYIDCTV